MNLKMCEIVTDVDKLKVDIQATIMKYTTIKQWCYIIHDKDDTRPHYHIGLHFGGASVDTKKVAEWFNLGYVDKDGVEHTGEQFVSKVNCGRWSGIVTYLVHGQDSQGHKFQYPTTEVHANFNVETMIANENVIGHFDKYSYWQMLNHIHSLPVSEQSSAYRLLDTLWKNHCKWLSKQTDRNISVMFITGKGGTGKTTYAKRIMNERFGDDFYISSSSNDPFCDYLGQKGIILDDARDKVFEVFPDFLKMLDNHTSSSISSRYVNKVLTGELIIITSSVPLRYWYRGRNTKGVFFAVDNEGFEQLYRRINCYVEVKEDTIIVYPEGLDNNGYPKGLGQIFKNNLKEEFKKQQPPQQINFCSMFEKLCGDSTESPFDGESEQLELKSVKKS